MKKVSFFFILLLIFCNSLFAQKFSVGIKDGINWSNIKGRCDFIYFENTQIKKEVGQNFGLIINYRINNFLFLQSEFNYEEKGFEFKNVLIGGGYSGNYELKYLTVPLIANFEFGRSVRYFSYTGFYFSILISADNQTIGTSTSTPELVKYDHSYDAKDQFNKNEIGAVIGLGIKIPLCDKVKLMIGGRYNFGLSKSAKNTEHGYNPQQWTSETLNNFQNIYNRSLSVNFGIIYNFKKQNKNVLSNEKCQTLNAKRQTNINTQTP